MNGYSLIGDTFSHDVALAVRRGDLHHALDVSSISYIFVFLLTLHHVPTPLLILYNKINFNNLTVDCRLFVVCTYPYVVPACAAPSFSFLLLPYQATMLRSIALSFALLPHTAC